MRVRGGVGENRVLEQVGRVPGCGALGVHEAALAGRWLGGDVGGLFLLLADSLNQPAADVYTAASVGGANPSSMLL